MSQATIKNNLLNPKTKSVNLIFNFDLSNNKSLELINKSNTQKIKIEHIIPPALSSSLDFSVIDPSKIDDYDNLSDFTKMFLGNVVDFQNLGDIRTYYSSKVDLMIPEIYNQIKKECSGSDVKLDKFEIEFRSNVNHYLNIENLIRPIVKKLYKNYKELTPFVEKKDFKETFSFKYNNKKSVSDISPACIDYYISNCKTWEEFTKIQEKQIAELFSKASKADLDKMAKLHHQLFHEGQEIADLAREKLNKKK